MELRRFNMIQLEGLHPRNPVTDEVITAHLQWFAVTDDMTGDFIDPTKIQPRADLYFGITEPIPMSKITKIDNDSLLYAIGMIRP